MYLYAKDEMLIDPDNPYDYSQEFLQSTEDESEAKEDYLVVETPQQFEELKDELLETMKLRSISEPVCCPICYTEFNLWNSDSMDSI